MIPNPGDTFAFTNPLTVSDDHLWIFVSDTERDRDRIVLLSMTSWTPTSDHACVVTEDDYGGAHRRSCISYEYARFIAYEEFDEGMKAKKYSHRPPISHVLLDRILLSAPHSRRIKRKFLAALREHWTI